MVFARRPELGRVKKRLDARIGETLTLALYRAFLTDTLNAARLSGARVILAHTPGPDFPERHLADIAYAQKGNTFGERFDFSLGNAARLLPDKTRLILVGADTPQLPPEFLRRALEILKDYDAVIGPNENGGFYLLGFSKPPIAVAEVFTRSAEEEPRELQRLLKRVKLRTTLLKPQFDVDLPEDLVKLNGLIDKLERTHANWIPKNTRDLLRSELLISITMLKEEISSSEKVELQLT
jgi:glycosyltransferase A (GT-A) superfamily protein (DUF2064 family)